MRKYGLILHKVIHNMHLCLCKSLHCFKTTKCSSVCIDSFLGEEGIDAHRGSCKEVMKSDFIFLFIIDI